MSSLYVYVNRYTFIAAAVRPADEHPMPVVCTAREAIDTAHNRSLDLAKPGSPIIKFEMNTNE